MWLHCYLTIYPSYGDKEVSECMHLLVGVQPQPGLSSLDTSVKYSLHLPSVLSAKEEFQLRSFPSQDWGLDKQLLKRKAVTIQPVLPENKSYITVLLQYTRHPPEDKIYTTVLLLYTRHLPIDKIYAIVLLQYTRHLLRRHNLRHAVVLGVYWRSFSTRTCIPTK